MAPLSGAELGVEVYRRAKNTSATIRATVPASRQRRGSAATTHATIRAAKARNRPSESSARAGHNEAQHHHEQNRIVGAGKLGRRISFLARAHFGRRLLPIGRTIDAFGSDGRIILADSGLGLLT
jgi:hypothetical protein